MAGESHIEFSWTKLTAAVNQAIGRMEEQFAAYSAQGDEVRAMATRARINLMTSMSTGGAAQLQGAAAELQRSNELLNQQVALKRLGQQLDTETLAILREQAIAETELAAARKGMTFGTARYQSYGQLAGPQAEAEAAAARRQVQMQGEMAALQAQTAASQRADEVASRRSAAYGAGMTAGSRGSLVPADMRAELAQVNMLTGSLTAAEREEMRLATAMGEYAGMSSRANLSTEALNANLTRMGMLEAEASNSMREHGALTTEYLSALARGETTVKEFGYQVGATIGKFAGWTAAAAATYGALGAVAEFGKGAIDAANGATKLQRTIEGVDTTRANTAIQQLSADANVSVSEAANAVFLFSRTFHNLHDATAAARDGLMAFKLDNVDLADSVKLATALNQQFGVSATGLVNVYNMLAAGQREYNARISEMVPLLQRSTGAVRNAGGNLNDLVALGAYSQRTTQYSGSQIGTAFYRSAATFLSPATTKGQTDRAVLQGLGINTGQGWTGIIRDALVRSVTLAPEDRQRIALAIFGPQYGGRMSAIFNPQSVPTYLQMTRRLTPEATQGSMQSEMNRELATARERMRSFVNEMQRMGAALGSSGMINVLSGIIHGVVTVGGEFRGLVTTFDSLSPAVKESVIAITALRALMMFTQRTRFGSTAADLTGLSHVPGFGASDTQRMRFDMRAGTTAALDTVNTEVSRTRAQLLGMGARQATLEQERAAIEGRIAQAGTGTQVEYEKANAISAKIETLQAEQNAIEARQNALLAERAGLLEQRVGLEKTRGPQAYSDQQVRNLYAASSEGTQSAADLAARDASQAGVYATAKAKLRSALSLSMTQEQTMAAETGLGTVMMGRASTVAEGAAGGIKGFGERVNGMLSSIGAFNFALLALPFIFGEISNAINQANDAAKAASAQAASPITDIQSLQAAAQTYAQRTRAARGAAQPGGLSGFFAHVTAGAGYFVAGNTGEKWAMRPYDRAATAASHAQQTGSELGALGTSYKLLSDRYSKDIAGLLGTKSGQEQAYTEAQRLKAAVGQMTRQGLKGLDDKDIGRAYQAFANALQQDYQAAAAVQYTKSKNPLSQYQDALRMDPAQLAKQLQANEDFQKVFGVNDQTLQQTLQGYAAFLTHAAAPGAGNNDTLMQEVATAQGNFVNAVTKQVQDEMRSATTATTTRGMEGDLTAALGTIEHAQGQVQALMEKFKNAPKILAGLSQLMGLIAEQGKQINQQILQVMQSQAAVATSSILGISPESDIARAQADVTALGQQLGYAQQHGFDALTMNDLQSRYNTARQTLLKTTIENARSILDASGKVTQSQITGIDPSSDIARAKAALQTAMQMLAFDQSHGAGTAAILTDQAAVNDAQRTLGQQVQQRDQQMAADAAAYIDSVAKLAESQTTDPAQIAKDELSAAIQTLATIRPQDFKTYQEYQTAYMRQLAQIGDARKSLTQANYQVQMDTLSFELHTQRITDQQYVDGLQQLLRMRKLSLQDRQRIMTEIFDTLHQTAVDLNVGNIKMPTTYEIRSLIRGASSRVGTTVVSTNTTNNVNVNVHVDSKHDPRLHTVTTAIKKAVDQVGRQAVAAGAV